MSKEDRFVITAFVVPAIALSCWAVWLASRPPQADLVKEERVWAGGDLTFSTPDPLATPYLMSISTDDKLTVQGKYLGTFPGLWKGYWEAQDYWGRKRCR